MDPSIKKILKLFPGKIFFIRPDRTILFSNSEFPETCRNLPCHKIIFNSDTPCHFCILEKNMQGQISLISMDMQKELQMKISPTATLESEDITLNQSVIEIEDSRLIVDKILDTPIKQFTEANDQLTTLGAHVQTMAHELSNPLTGLNLTCQKMESILKTKNQNELLEFNALMELLKKDIQRASEVVSEIRNYSRPVSKSYKIFDLKLVLKSAIDNVVRVSAQKNVNLTFKWNLAGVFHLRGNPIKLEQCFINIIKNSFDMFSIRKSITNPFINISVNALKPEKSVLIQIIDNAGGISNAALKNVFKPYFTTKEKFRGLGLGLYIAGKILKEHHSTISIESIQETTMVTIKMQNQETR